MHARIARIRANALHQATHAIAKTKPCTIVLEDLNVKGMMANRKMSRAVGDVGMYEFKRQITYKAEKYGSIVNTVSQWFRPIKHAFIVGGLMKTKTCLIVSLSAIDVDML